MFGDRCDTVLGVSDEAKSVDEPTRVITEREAASFSILIMLVKKACGHAIFGSSDIRMVLRHTHAMQVAKCRTVEEIV
jgi:hypothetical protein